MRDRWAGRSLWGGSQLISSGAATARASGRRARSGSTRTRCSCTCWRTMVRPCGRTVAVGLAGWDCGMSRSSWAPRVGHLDESIEIFEELRKEGMHAEESIFTALVTPRPLPAAPSPGRAVLSESLRIRQRQSPPDWLDLSFAACRSNALATPAVTTRGLLRSWNRQRTPPSLPPATRTVAHAQALWERSQPSGMQRTTWLAIGPPRGECLGTQAKVELAANKSKLKARTPGCAHRPARPSHRKAGAPTACTVCAGALVLDGAHLGCKVSKAGRSARSVAGRQRSMAGGIGRGPPVAQTD